MYTSEGPVVGYTGYGVCHVVWGGGLLAFLVSSFLMAGMLLIVQWDKGAGGRWPRPHFPEMFYT